MLKREVIIKLVVYSDQTHTVQMEWVLRTNDEHFFLVDWPNELTPPPTAPPGSDISIVLDLGRAITDPLGSKDAAVSAPLKI